MLSVMIVDDERIDREAYKIMIEKSNSDFKVIAEAENGIDALKQCEILKPDIMLLDINMPGLNGIDVMKQIRPYHPNMHIIIITAYDKFEYAKDAIYQGAAGYILKPVSEQDLMQEMESLRDKIKQKSIDQNNKENRTDSTTTYPLKVKKIIEYCNSNYHNDINLKSAAADLYMSANYIGKLIKEYLGTNFTDYLTVLRIEKAKELLEGTEDSISDVAEAVGYQDPNYFIKVFKKITNTTPSRYRKRIRWNEQYILKNK